MKRMVLGLMMVAVLASGAFAIARTPQNITEGKELADSLAATADTLTALQLPDTQVASFYLGLFSDSSTVYTVQLSPNGIKWFTAFVDTCLKGTYDEHQLLTGTPLPGLRFRVIADNLTATTSWARVYSRAID